jgi:hypothetical protein
MTFEFNDDLKLGIFHNLTTIFAIFLTDKAYLNNTFRLNYNESVIYKIVNLINLCKNLIF